MAGVHCAHCGAADCFETNEHFRCEHCAGLTAHDGQPFIPTKCGRCGGDVEWDALDRYTCVGRTNTGAGSCGRRGYGPYPRVPLTAKDDPAEARRNAPGVIKGTLYGQRERAAS